MGAPQIDISMGDMYYNCFRDTSKHYKAYLSYLFDSLNDLLLENDVVELVLHKTNFVQFGLENEAKYNKDYESYKQTSSGLVLFFLSNSSDQVIKTIKGLILEQDKTLFSLLDSFGISLKDLEENIVLSMRKDDRVFIEVGSKKIISKIRKELPLFMSNILDIDLGYFYKSDGSQMTLKEYSKITNTSIEELEKILAQAKAIVIEKIKRKEIENAFNIVACFAYENKMNEVQK